MTPEVSSRAPIYALVATLIAVEWFAMRAQDPEFFFPDPFRPLVVGLLVLFVVLDRVRTPRARVPAMVVLITLPWVLLLLEWRTAASDAKLSGRVVRLARSESDRCSERAIT